MSSYFERSMLSFSASAAIALGKAVTVDATGKIVTASNASTDKSIGVAQSDATLSGASYGFVEVALAGGGAKGLAGGTIAAGDLVAPTTGGALITTTTPGDRYVGVAMQDAASGDLFSMHVQSGLI